MHPTNHLKYGKTNKKNILNPVCLLWYNEKVRFISSQK